ncbi:MAG TPA: hypothetical protein VFD76_10190 [Gemmatimonadales bacterium]|nr:hypothetical protein [Gemmatimonadales bacterium]
MIRPCAVVPLVFVVLTASAARAQTCSEPHYRWSEKIDQSLAGKTPMPVDVSDMLTWVPRGLTAKDQCALRAGRELDLFVVSAYVRRIRLHEQDGDWHIEVTEEETSPVPASCIVFEIPAPTYGAVYGAAREQLAALVDTTKLGAAGDLATPILVTFTGAAFFDGYHQKRGANGVVRASQHGRCNSSVRALWELHPVYKVETPPGP